MRVLLCHVRYRDPGGEDAVFDSEVLLLREAGADVATLELSSEDLHRLSISDRTRMALRYADHDVGRRLVRSAIERHRPSVVHFHNLYPHLGPGAIREARRLGCATVQTLHNYRLSCLMGRHLRKDAFCRSCSPGRFGAGIAHACYRGSRTQSLLAARATTRQWRDFVEGTSPDYWLVLTPFMKAVYEQLGAPPERILVKANSVDRGRPQSREGRSGVFCGGRLSAEKGIVPLMRAWPDDGPLLTVAGDGPVRDLVRSATKHNVCYVGHLDPAEMRASLRKALVAAMPSIWPEALPLVALEALAEGTPVIAFQGGSLGSVVEEVSSTCLVSPPRFAGLVHRAVSLTGSPDWQELSDRCIDVWSRRYSPSVNRDALLEVYAKAAALER
jgi:glycosyltransferase involved in cell wall biosynthesis